MADEDTEETTEASPAAGDVEHRVDSLESKVDKILGILGGGGNAGEQQETQRPANIAEEIRAQLDEVQRKDKAAAAEQAKDDRLGALEVKVGELAEKPPESMPRRIEKIMGWR